eukprot:311981-Pelagomonas_calceolata.AAC.1
MTADCVRQPHQQGIQACLKGYKGKRPPQSRRLTANLRLKMLKYCEKEEEKATKAEKTLPTSIKERETDCLKEP